MNAVNLQGAFNISRGQSDDESDSEDELFDYLNTKVKRKNKPLKLNQTKDVTCKDSQAERKVKSGLDLKVNKSTHTDSISNDTKARSTEESTDNRKTFFNISNDTKAKSSEDSFAVDQNAGFPVGPTDCNGRANNGSKERFCKGSIFESKKEIRDGTGERHDSLSTVERTVLLNDSKISTEEESGSYTSIEDRVMKSEYRAVKFDQYLKSFGAFEDTKSQDVHYSSADGKEVHSKSDKDQEQHLHGRYMSLSPVKSSQSLMDTDQPNLSCQSDTGRSQAFIPNIKTSPRPTQYKFVRDGSKLIRVAVVQEETTSTDVFYDGLYDNQMSEMEMAKDTNLQKESPLPEHKKTENNGCVVMMDNVSSESLKSENPSGQGGQFTSQLNRETGQNTRKSCALEPGTGESIINFSRMEEGSNKLVIGDETDIVKRTDSDFMEYLENTCLSENASTSSQISLCSNELPIVVKVGPDGRLTECAKCPASVGNNEHLIRERKTEMDISFLSMRIEKLESDILEMKRSSDGNDKDNIDKVSVNAKAELIPSSINQSHSHKTALKDDVLVDTSGNTQEEQQSIVSVPSKEKVEHTSKEMVKVKDKVNAHLKSSRKRKASNSNLKVETRKQSKIAKPSNNSNSGTIISASESVDVILGNDDEDNEESDFFMTFKEDHLQKLYQEKLREVKQIQCALQKMHRKRSKESDHTDKLNRSSSVECNQDLSKHMRESEMLANTQDKSEDCCTNELGLEKKRKKADTIRKCVKKVNKTMRQDAVENKAKIDPNTSKKHKRSKVPSTSSNTEKATAGDKSLVLKVSRKLFHPRKNDKKKSKVNKKVTWNEEESSLCDDQIQSFNDSPNVNHENTENSPEVRKLTRKNRPRAFTQKKLRIMPNSTNNKQSKSQGKPRCKSEPQKNSNTKKVSRTESVGKREKEQKQSEKSIKSNKKSNNTVYDKKDISVKKLKISKVKSSDKAEKNMSVTKNSARSCISEIDLDTSATGNSVIKGEVDSIVKSPQKSENFDSKRQNLETIISEKFTKTVESRMKKSQAKQSKGQTKRSTCEENSPKFYSNKRKLSDDLSVSGTTSSQSKEKLQKKRLGRPKKLKKSNTVKTRMKAKNVSETNSGEIEDIALKHEQKRQKRQRKRILSKIAMSKSGHVGRVAFEKSYDYTWKEKLETNVFPPGLLDKKESKTKPMNVKKMIKSILVSSSPSLSKSRSTKHKKKHTEHRNNETSDIASVVTDSDEACMSDGNASFPGIRLADTNVKPTTEGSTVDSQTNNQESFQEKVDCQVLESSTLKVTPIDGSLGSNREGETETTVVIEVCAPDDSNTQEDSDKNVQESISNVTRSEATDKVNDEGNSFVNVNSHTQLEIQTKWDSDACYTDSDTENKNDTENKSDWLKTQNAPASPKFSKTYHQIRSLLVRRDKIFQGTSAIQNLPFNQE